MSFNSHITNYLVIRVKCIYMIAYRPILQCSYTCVVGGITTNVGSPETDVDMDYEDTEWEAITEILDTTYYEHTVETTNMLVQEHTNWWMSKASECLRLSKDMKDLLVLYNVDEAHTGLVHLLEQVPSFSEHIGAMDSSVHVVFVDLNSSMSDILTKIDSHKVMTRGYLSAIQQELG